MDIVKDCPSTKVERRRARFTLFVSPRGAETAGPEGSLCSIKIGCCHGRPLRSLKMKRQESA